MLSFWLINVFLLIMTLWRHYISHNNPVPNDSLIFYFTKLFVSPYWKTKLSDITPKQLPISESSDTESESNYPRFTTLAITSSPNSDSKFNNFDSTSLIPAAELHSKKTLCDFELNGGKDLNMQWEQSKKRKFNVA